MDNRARGVTKVDKRARGVAKVDKRARGVTKVDKSDNMATCVCFENSSEGDSPVVCARA